MQTKRQFSTLPLSFFRFIGTFDNLYWDRSLLYLCTISFLEKKKIYYLCFVWSICTGGIFSIRLTIFTKDLVFLLWAILGIFWVFYCKVCVIIKPDSFSLIVLCSTNYQSKLIIKPTLYFIHKCVLHSKFPSVSDPLSLFTFL